MATTRTVPSRVIEAAAEAEMDADEVEQHHAMEDDGAASASLVRCLTLPWFSHSAGDVLQIAPARSLHRRLRCAVPILGRKVTGNQIRMLLHSGFSLVLACGESGARFLTIPNYKSNGETGARQDQEEKDGRRASVETRTSENQNVAGL